MIPAAPTRFGRWVWQNFCRYSIRLAFSDFQIVGDAQRLDPQRSGLLIGNHISWWDGFWPIELNRRLWRREYYVMMLESQLSIRPFMRRGGAFSIDPGQRSMVQSVRYAAELLQDPQHLVLIFPQGKIHSQYDHDFSFAPGVSKVLQLAGDRTQVIFYAALLDYGSQARPILRMYLETPELAPGQDLAPAYQRFFEASVQAQQAWVLAQHTD